ncbi:MAG: PorT family protein, partial [Hymenobacter sp.]
MSRKFTSLLLSSLSLAALAAQAQTTFSIGPLASLNVVGASNTATSTTTNTSTTIIYRLGFEAGLQSILQFGHLAVQPSLRFSQKGFHRHYGYDLYSSYTDYRLNYLTLPLNVAYSLRTDGQGFQVFAGPYVALLLGGNYQLTTDERGPFGSIDSSEGHIKPGKFDPYASLYSTSNDRYCRRFDAGVQAGLGYCYNKFLVQADFAFGLSDLALLSSSARNRTVQASLSHQIGDL